MRRHIDPVCGRRINRNKAHIVVSYERQEYYLCCPICQREFEQNPRKYAGNVNEKMKRI